MLAESVTFATGTMQAKLGSRVVRDLDLTFDESMFPWEDDDLLAPFGNELRAYKGVRFAEGTEYIWPIFRGKIQSAEMDPGGFVAVSATDRAQEVLDNQFQSPAFSVVGEPVLDEIVRVIRDRLPGATFGTHDVFYAKVPQLSWEQDPGSALDEMATALGAFWYPLADGEFVVRLYPWTVRRDPVVSLRDGDGGMILASSPARVRGGYNVVVVTGERADGSAPVSAFDEDDDPASPTYVDGPYGRRTLVRRLNTPTSPEMAKAAARALRRRTTALTTAWRLSMTPDAAMELGDVLDLEVRGRTGVVQVVESITMPLGTGAGAMDVQGRAQVFDKLAGEDF
jgi:hypothetical protein